MTVIVINHSNLKSFDHCDMPYTKGLGASSI